MFIEIDSKFLKSIATDSERLPSLYYSRYWLLKNFFWMRLKLINYQINKLKVKKSSCLDFGGGGGVFLPTLSHQFKAVVLIDLETLEASKVIEKYGLKNVRLIKDDIATANILEAPFDVIVAADVLEHFQDLSVPVAFFRKFLKEDGVLITSLPTENFIYTSLRKVFNVTKPWDHYYTGYEVESYLKRAEFKQITSNFVPLFYNIFPLFLISAWQLNEPFNSSPNTKSN